MSTHNGPTLIAGLRFSLLLGWKHRLPAGGPTVFWLAALLSVCTDIALNWFLIDSTDGPYPEGLSDSTQWILLSLLLSWLLCQIAQRQAWIWSLATWILISSMLMRAAVGPLFVSSAYFDGRWLMFEQSGFVMVLLAWMFLAGLRMWRWLEPGWPFLRCALFAMVTAGGFALPLNHLPYCLGYFNGQLDDSESIEEIAAAALVPINIENLFAEQDQRVDAALAQLAPQRPGIVDLYVVAVAGYASEDVFGNEVHYVQKLFNQRFETAGRSLLLINHRDTLDSVPLATERNLQRVLDGIAARIDIEEDIVFLFVTSHGSEDHQLAIELGGLPLQQIKPDALADAIGESGIRWRIAAISACYSGGFISALRSDTALVMTAARADRTSFGCGADSDITYFGRAYFAEALNQTADFAEAFAIASASLAVREQDEDQTPSEPQIANGALIAEKLSQWRAQFVPGDAIPFNPEFSQRATSADAP